MSVVSQRLFSFPPGQFRWTVGIFVVALFFAVETVNASCGDYLHANHMEDHHTGISVIAPFDGFDALFTSSAEPTSSSPRCTGPFCQHAPHAPADRPQSDQPSLTHREFCLWITLGILDNESWFALNWISDCSPKSPEASRLDRPPQAA